MKLGSKGKGSEETTRNNTSGNEKIQERVEKLCKEELFSIGYSNLDPNGMWQEMKRAIEKAGFVYYGRGQNRITFGAEGDGYVYKVPFREIGLRDNLMEKINAMSISSSAEAYDEIGDFFPLVTNFSIGNTKDEIAFCIEMEFIDDLESVNYPNGTVEQKSINAYIENIEAISDAIRAANKYFHMLDLHPCTSAVNIGLKNGKPCFRDIGYFVPRIGELTDIEHTVQNIPVEYLYVPYDFYEGDIKGMTMIQKQRFFESIAESFYPVDRNTGKQVGGKDAFVDATAILTTAIDMYAKMIMTGDFDDILVPRYSRW